MLKFKKHHPVLYVLTFVTTLSVAFVEAAEPLFEDVTATAFTSVSEPGASQYNGAGLAWIDFNNDGWADLFIPKFEGNNYLYRNNQDGTFTDVADATVRLNSKSSLGVVVGDFDNDGWDDIFVLNNTVNTLLRNKGDGGDDVHDGFEDVTGTDTANPGMGLWNESKSSYAASFGDIDDDGDLDLFVGHWPTSVNDFYQNQLAETGVASFVRVDNGLQNTGDSVFAILFTDYNDDGSLDTIVVKDFNVGVAEPNFFINDGEGNFSSDPAAPSLSLLGMGIAAGDYDVDGDLDYYTTTIVCDAEPANQINLLAINQGAGNFDITQTGSAGIKGEEGLDPCGVNGGHVYWGTNFFDVDNDGFPDLYAANQDFNSMAASHMNRLYMNNGDITNPAGPTFTEKSTASRTDVIPGNGTVVADYDHDGRLDMAIHGQLGSLVLLHNITPPENDWLQLELAGSESNQRGVGAKVRVTSTSAAGTVTQMQEVHAGTSHGSSNAFPVHFGIPSGSTIDVVRIEWPMGQVDTFTGADIPLNQRTQLTEGLGIVNTPRVDAVYLPAGDVTWGSAIVLLGQNFCVSQCNAFRPTETTVTINGTPTSVELASNSLLWFYVPIGTTGTGNITVTTLGRSGTSAQTVTVVAPPVPVISFLSHTEVNVGSMFGIIGSNFCVYECPSSSSTEVTVTINGVTLTPDYVDSNVILIFNMPASAAGTGPVTVTTLTQQSAPSRQTVTVLPPPIITSLLMTAGSIGNAVIILGNNFCDISPSTPCSTVDPDWIQLSMNGIPLQIQDSQTTGYPFPQAYQYDAGRQGFIFILPEDATTGRITITTPNGSATSSEIFTVY